MNVCIYIYKFKQVKIHRKLQHETESQHTNEGESKAEKKNIESALLRMIWVELESNKKEEEKKFSCKEKKTHCSSANFLSRTFFILLKNTFHKCTVHIIFASPLDISYNFIISVGTCLHAFEVTM